MNIILSLETSQMLSRFGPFAVPQLWLRGLSSQLIAIEPKMATKIFVKIITNLKMKITIRTYFKSEVSAYKYYFKKLLWHLTSLF